MPRFVWKSRIILWSATFLVLFGGSLSIAQSPPPKDGDRTPKTERPPSKEPRRPPTPDDRRDADRRRPVVVERELMVTDLSVIEHPVFSDPNAGDAAVWSFRYLIEQMSGDQDPSDFAEALFQVQANRRVNGYDVPGRPLAEERILAPWRERSGGGKLDLSLAPFKLLAIVNRVDLRQIIDGNVLQAAKGASSSERSTRRGAPCNLWPAMRRAG